MSCHWACCYRVHLAVRCPTHSPSFSTLGKCAGGFHFPYKQKKLCFEKKKNLFDSTQNTLDSFSLILPDSWLDRYKNPKPDWSVFREASFGHGELKIVNSTHAFWSWHRNDDDEPVQSDHVWINSLVNSGCILNEKNDFREILISP